MTLIVLAFGDVASTEPTGDPITELGTAIFSEWVFPFEVVSMLLLAALVGAVLLARRDSGESGEEADVEIILDALPTPADVEADRREAAAELAHPDNVTASPQASGGGQ